MTQWPGRDLFFAQATQLVRKQDQACVLLQFPVLQNQPQHPNTAILKILTHVCHTSAAKGIYTVYIFYQLKCENELPADALWFKNKDQESNQRYVYKELIHLVRGPWTLATPCSSCWPRVVTVQLYLRRQERAVFKQWLTLILLQGPLLYSQIMFSGSLNYQIAFLHIVPSQVKEKNFCVCP